MGIIALYLIQMFFVWFACCKLSGVMTSWLIS